MAAGINNLERNTCITNKHLLYKRTKYLFNIPKILPNTNIPPSVQRQYLMPENRLYYLYEAFRNISKLNLLPVQVVQCKRLTKEQVAALKEELTKYTVSDQEVEDFLSKETGKERLKRMWSKDHFGLHTKEFEFVVRTTTQCFSITFFTMMWLRYFAYKREFRMTNQSASFTSNFLASRRMRDKAVATSLTFAGSLASRVTILIGTTLAVSQSIAVYRNKSSVLEYVIGTGVGCGLTRFYHGPEGMLVGFVLGSVIGLAVGGVAVLFMKASNSTQPERTFVQIREYIRYKKKVIGDKTETETASSLDLENKKDNVLKPESIIIKAETQKT